jgi:hypothetical protein
MIQRKSVLQHMRMSRLASQEAYVLAVLTSEVSG